MQTSYEVSASLFESIVDLKQYLLDQPKTFFYLFTQYIAQIVQTQTLHPHAHVRTDNNICKYIQPNTCKIRVQYYHGFLIIVYAPSHHRSKGDQDKLELCPYPWIRELREPTKLLLLTLHLYAFTQATLCQVWRGFAH